MKKKFNITGLCIPEKHYMVDISANIDAIMAMVEEGAYFVINRPRQYGKTTTLALLKRRLQPHPGFFPLSISFEGISSESYCNEQRFVAAFLWQFRKALRMQPQPDLRPLVERGVQVTTLPELDEWISTFVMAASFPIVLMIDEVDKSSNHQLFLDFLAMLRTKYLAAAAGEDFTFHSVILAGVHDIKSLKLKLRPDDDRKYNSPWNIAVDFTIDLTFHPADIETMLAEYADATGVMMDRTDIAAQLWHYTSGHPFLVSAVCKIIDEELKQHLNWQVDDVDEAVNRLLLKQNTNFESLITNLENSPNLYALIERLVLLDEQIEYNEDNHLLHLGLMYGILGRRQDMIAIHNRIYRERILNYLTINLKLQHLSAQALAPYTRQDQFLNPDRSLNIMQVLLKFQGFMKQEYSQRDAKFLERHGRLVFFAFLRPVLNGRGFAFKEPHISEEKRLDVVITFEAQKHVIELKIWRGDTAHQRGLHQLADYLERSGHHDGALVIFDFTQKGRKSWKQEHIQVDGKDIFAIWV